MGHLQFAKANVAGIFLTLLGREKLDAEWIEPVDNNPHYVATARLPYGDKIVGRAFDNGYWEVWAELEPSAGAAVGHSPLPYIGIKILLASGCPPEPIETETMSVSWSPERDETMEKKEACHG